MRGKLDVPVIFLTAFSDDETLDRAKRTGPFGYLLKPFKEDDLHVAIQCALWRHEMEREATEKKARFETQLRHTQKMEAIGQLIAGVSHNFNNALAVVLGNIELLQIQDADNENLADARAAAAQAADMVKQLMLFYRQSRQERTTFEFQSFIGDITRMCRGIFDRRIAIEFESGDQQVLVSGNIGQLRQVVLNLLINARDILDEMPEEAKSPRIEVALATLRYEDQDEVGHPEGKLGSYIRLDVCDNGRGMDPLVQERIFEPFFTTKEVGKGTGLGLASVYAIIKEHRGWIECVSEVGKGTRFAVYLPAIEREDALVAGRHLLFKAGERANDYPSGEGEIVLVIEDDELVQNTLTTMLAEFDYSVLIAGDGVEGLEIFKSRREDIDLVILDLSMPKTSGREVLGELLALNPDLKVIIATGYGSEEVDLPGAKMLLEKPFQVGRLVRALRQLLDE